MGAHTVNRQSIKRLKKLLCYFKKMTKSPRHMNHGQRMKLFFDDYDGYIMIIMVSTYNKARERFLRQLQLKAKGERDGDWYGSNKLFIRHQFKHNIIIVSKNSSKKLSIIFTFKTGEIIIYFWKISGNCLGTE